MFDQQDDKVYYNEMKINLGQREANRLKVDLVCQNKPVLTTQKIF